MTMTRFFFQSTETYRQRNLTENSGMSWMGEVTEPCRFKNDLFNLVCVSIHLQLYFASLQQLLQKPNEWSHYNSLVYQESKAGRGIPH